MTNLDIKIEINILLYYSRPWESTVGKKTLLMMMKPFAEYIRVLYLRSIREAMKSPRYKGKWEPRDEEGYLGYLGVDTFSDDISMLMEEALEVKKIGKNYFIRFNPYYKYPKSSLSLIRVLRAIEHGTSDFSARPILVKCKRNIQRNLRELWIGYLTLRGVI